MVVAWWLYGGTKGAARHLHGPPAPDRADVGGRAGRAPPLFVRLAREVKAGSVLGAVLALVGVRAEVGVGEVQVPPTGVRLLPNVPSAWSLALQGKIHRVDPDFGSTLTFANRDSQPNCWVNWNIMGQACGFQVCG